MTLPSSPGATGNDVRVRFAPSPTGTPHVGMIRTALFNWAWARHTGGTFVFRLEDTDPQRDSAESAAQLVEAMRWLGLEWDEGVEKGGRYGPYRQSERFDLYRGIIDRLVEAGYVYESYSTAEEIAARNVAAGRPKEWGYDGYDRTLTESQKAAFREEGRQPSLRMRMPEEDITFTDMVRGEITFKAGSVPDYVVVRSGGHPLYTLVNPIDDAMMRITHVLRGEDLLSSTPRQVVMHRALVELGVSEQIPQFGHLPYVMGEGNKKLSKRDPQSDLFLHRENGFIPEGLVNYLALLGWSISPDHDVFSTDELIAAFDIHHVNPNPARFDLKKAEAINSAQVRMLELPDFTRRLVPYLATAGMVSANSYDDLGPEERRVLEAAAPLVHERLALLGQAPGMLGFLFVSDQALEVESSAAEALRKEAPEVLDRAIAVVESCDDLDNVDQVEQMLRDAIVTGMEIKPKFAFAPLRVAVTGRRVSPPLFESMQILGRAATLARLRTLRASL